MQYFTRNYRCQLYPEIKTYMYSTNNYKLFRGKVKRENARRKKKVWQPTPLSRELSFFSFFQVLLPTDTVELIYTYVCVYVRMNNIGSQPQLTVLGNDGFFFLYSKQVSPQKNIYCSNPYLRSAVPTTWLVEHDGTCATG